MGFAEFITIQRSTVMAGVGSNVVFEDDKIKVWKFNLEPGEQTAVHTHEMEYVFYVIKGSTLEVFDAEQNDRQEADEFERIEQQGPSPEDVFAFDGSGSIWLTSVLIPLRIPWGPRTRLGARSGQWRLRHRLGRSRALDEGHPSTNTVAQMKRHRRSSSSSTDGGGGGGAVSWPTPFSMVQ